LNGPRTGRIVFSGISYRFGECNLQKSPEYPSLSSRVRLQLLDTGHESKFYLLAPSGAYCKIPEPLYRFLLLLDGSRSMADLQKELDRGSYEGLSGCPIEDIWANFVLPRRLLEAEPAIGRRKGPRFRRKFLIPLFSGRRAEPASRLTRVLFTLPAAIVLALMAVALEWISGARLFLHWQAAAIPFDWVHALLYLAALPVGAGVHELGHVSACHRSGCEAGKMGIGFRYCFPLAYAEVSRSWELGRRQRMLVDLGGVYFQFIASVALCGLHLLTGNAAWGLIGLLYLSGICVNLFPFLKSDGYWFLSDALGVPNLMQSAIKAFGRILGKPFGLTGGRGEYEGWRAAALSLYGGCCAAFALPALLAPFFVLRLAIGWIQSDRWRSVINFWSGLPHTLGHPVTPSVVVALIMHGLVSLILAGFVIFTCQTLVTIAEIIGHFFRKALRAADAATS
jgi:putative peptide zinc metalloprotease protein